MAATNREDAVSNRSRARIPFAVLLAALAACDAVPPNAPSFLSDRATAMSVASLGRPVSFLTAHQQAQFKRGRVVFTTDFTPETGLGPLFNSTGCAECHEDPVVGATGDEVEVHATAYHPSGQPACSDLSDVGGPVVQQHVTQALHDALGIDAEPLPEGFTATAHRTSPSILGFGLLDAVPEAEIQGFADAQARGHDGVSGRPNRTPDGRLGRFGRKAQSPTLSEFTAGAFIQEMGITSPSFPTELTVAGKPLPAGVDPARDPELSQDDLDAADAFVRFLDAPTPLAFAIGQLPGRKIFSRIGCAECHIPALTTGPNPVQAFNNKIVPGFTDLLLHDMGPDLADICLGEAEPAEFRTEPLMGLRFVTAFLHDGRAATIDEAIRLHAGEATAARDRFLALSDGERGVLLKFLGKL